MVILATDKSRTSGGLLRRTAYFSDDEWQAILAAAEAETRATGERVTAAEIIRRAVRDYLTLPTPKCCYCGSKRRLSLDHVEPQAIRGPGFDPSNAQVLCQQCNSEKGDKQFDSLADHYERLAMRARARTP